MNSFTIRDLENLSGIKAHTIRIWEQRYSFLKPKRSSTNIRYYEGEELKMLLNIALLNKHGYKISQIDRMGPDAIREKILSLNSAEARQEILINSLMHCMIGLNGHEFEQILDDHIKEHGIDRTITTLVFPFLEKIGLLWMTDHVRVAQEHLVSNIIRQKLILGIEHLPRVSDAGKKIVMYLPEGELHELALLYMWYLMKKRGFEVLYLGANLPGDELEFVVKSQKPDFLYTHITALPGKLSFDKYLTMLENRLAPTPVIISGRLVRGYFKKVPANVRLAKTIQDAILSLV